MKDVGDESGIQHTVSGIKQEFVDDVPWVFTTKDIAADIHHVQYIFVADIHNDALDPVMFERFDNTKITHSCQNNAIVDQSSLLMQMIGNDIDEEIAIINHTVMVTGDYPVSVTVKGEPDIRTARFDQFLERLRIGWTNIMIDV